MSKSQQYFIGLLVSFLFLSVFVFRTDLLIVAGRPGISYILQNYVGTWGITFSILGVFYFVSKLLKINFLYSFFVLIFIEASYGVLLHNGPKWFPDSAKLNPWFIHLKRMAGENKPLIQFDARCAQYDPELFYTLKPGMSRFKSYDFDNEYHINSKGFRDSEQDLTNPEVIFLGDSFTMGWGIDQDSTFAELFQAKTGLKTLNTGISSYGTAREYRAFERTAVDSLKLIVIQYHDTDIEENHHFVTKNKLGDKTQEDYDIQVNANHVAGKYYLFKYLKKAIVDIIVNDFFPSKKEAKPGLNPIFEDNPHFLADFYIIFEKIRNRFNGPIIITYTGSYETNPAVIEAFQNYAKQQNIPNVYFVNIAESLNPSHYFYLDDHLNSKGHVVVSEAVYQKFTQISRK